VKSWLAEKCFMTKLTAERLRKAEADVRIARRALAARPLLTDNAAFSCQQAVEKYIKALLQEAGLPVPKTHDLVKLHKLLPPPADSLKAQSPTFQEKEARIGAASMRN
jgi:HEPN domain-containing protein